MARILLIDDDEIVRSSIAAMLQISGHEVVEAGSCEQGVAIFATVPIDLTITDMVMPGQDGTETIVRLRTVKATTPIIAISGARAFPMPEMAGDAKIDVLDMAREVGADALLGKPFTRKQLADLVEFVLSHASAGQAAEATRRKSLLESGDDLVERQTFLTVEQAEDEILLIAKLEIAEGYRILDRPVGLSLILDGNDLEIPPRQWEGQYVAG